MKTTHKVLQKREDDIIVPEISANDARNENLSPRGDIISGLILIPTNQKTADTKEKIELRLETNAVLVFFFSLPF